MSETKPIIEGEKSMVEVRAEELANSGKFARSESLDPELVEQFGPTAVKLFRRDREARRRIDELCAAAQAARNGEKGDRGS
jgi:hypothetical protein